MEDIKLTGAVPAIIKSILPSDTMQMEEFVQVLTSVLAPGLLLIHGTCNEVQKISGATLGFRIVIQLKTDRLQKCDLDQVTRNKDLPK